jgi:hypothetical protein
MAVQVAHALRRDKHITSAFWICATSASTFERDYEGIAHLVDIPGNLTRSSQSLLQGVQTWLEDPENGTWLVVLDDVDNSDIERDTTELQTTNKNSTYNASARFLPRPVSHGYMLITTGDSDLALQLVKRTDLLFKIPRLSTTEACELLRSKTPDVVWFDPSSEEHARRLVTKLDNHPSAIVLAAAYIDSHHKLGETISEYLKGLTSHGHAELLSRGPYGLLVSNGFPPSPISAWQKSFTKIQNEYGQAVDILALMSCLDQTQIPKSLLECYNLSANDLRHRLRTLERYSFIDTYDNGNTFQMPRLLQLTAQEWFHGQGTRAMWQIKALAALFEQYNKIHKESQGSSIPAYVRQRQLLSHVDIFEQYCSKKGPPVDLISEITPALVSFAGLYAGEGRYGPAQRLLCYVRDYYQVEDSWRIAALRDLAETIRSQLPSTNEKFEERSDKLKKARDILLQAREIAQKTKDRNAEIDVLTSLALNYSDIRHIKPAEGFQKDFKRHFKLAENFQKDIIAHKTKQHGELHLETINATLGLSKIHFRRGRNRLETFNSTRASKAEAHEDLTKAEIAQVDLVAKMQSQTAKFPKDAECASVLYDIRAALARSYFSQGKIELALEQARAAHDGRLKLFGQYDLKTLGVEEDLCACLVELGQIKEAEERLQSVLERLTEKFGGGGYLVERCEIKLRHLRARKGAIV